MIMDFELDEYKFPTNLKALEFLNDIHSIPIPPRGSAVMLSP